MQTDSNPKDKPNQQQIKINLKFNKGGTLKTVESGSSIDPPTDTASNAVKQPVVKKSRFSSNISNVVQEQNRFKQQQETPVQPTTSRSEEICSEDTASTSVSASATTPTDIVYDINKWPDTLKNYCARVYKHYATISQVSEDQVTKYLQKKITDAFKVTPDLNTGWETEAIPEIYDIKQVSI